jgi:hypothetical protein
MNQQKRNIENITIQNQRENMTEINKGNRILLIGIGIFFWLGIGSFATLLKIITVDVLFHLTVNPYLIKIFGDLIYFFTHIIGVIVLIKIIKSERFSETKLFVISFLIIIFSQVLQGLEPFIASNLRTKDSLDNTINYYDFLKENVNFTTVMISLEFILFIVVGLMIYINRKKTLANNGS